MLKFGLVCLAVVFAAEAGAQSAVRRVTGTVSGAGAGISAGTAAGSTTGAPDFSALNSSPGAAAGGDWNGGARTRVGGKDVTIRGAVASEGGSSAFKAGAGVGF
ncbi:MAG: hypothetical protein V4661_12220 [Pseudomonadota bacterium]